MNFAVYSSGAERVEICLFADDGATQQECIALPGRSGDIWHGRVEGIKPGQRYGLRVQGPYDPSSGARFNPAMLLLDPYARAIDRPLAGDASQFGYVIGSEEEDLEARTEDNGASAAKAVVVDSTFDWGGELPPHLAPRETQGEPVFYEVHVKGFTQRMPGVPDTQRGTYAGMGSEAAIAHLKSLGVTTVELLPVQAFADDKHLVDKGLRNYWGYNTLAFFAPEPRYAVGPAVDEFKAMVRALHAAGLEVVLDVVYNHTAEGNHLGPTLSFRGIDNAAYYRLSEDPRYYVDFTGTGNSLDLSSPPALRLVLDSLRYWVEEMHVDGFRFDLAVTLGRDPAGAFSHRSAFLAAVWQDPVLSRVKLIAEPWDLGPDGYQVGGFPAGWMEWNGRWRDTVRDWWRNCEGCLPAFAQAFSGTPPQEGGERFPARPVNIVTVHDGFTLHDLVSYHERRNEANGEDNRDGESHNRSWNCGAEGPTDDEAVLALRKRQMRNFLATLMLARGAPLLLAGDEFGRTQQGSNNAYCQDNEISWLDWEAADREQLDFTAALLALRRGLPAVRGNGPAAWFSVWGLPVTPEEWSNPQVCCAGVLLEGGEDDSAVLVLFNASAEEAVFTLPQEEAGRRWTLALDTRTAAVPPRPAAEGGAEGAAAASSGEHWPMEARSVAVFTGPQGPAR